MRPILDHQFPCCLFTGVERIHGYFPPLQIEGAEELSGHGNLVGLGIDPCTAHEELAGHADRPQDRLTRFVAGLLAIHRDRLVGWNRAAHLGLDQEQAFLKVLGIDLGQEAGEGRLAWGRERFAGAGADSNSTMLGLIETTGKLGQVFLTARGITQHPQQHEGRRGFWGVGLGAGAIIGQVLEVIGQRPEFGFHVIASCTGLLLHGGEEGLDVLGLKASPCVAGQFPNKELLGFVVGHVVVPLVTSVTVSHAQLLPPLRDVNSTLEPFGVDEGFDDQDGVAAAGLPVGTETIESEAKDAGTQIGLMGLGQDEGTAAIGDQAQTAVPLSTGPADPVVAVLEVLCRSAENQEASHRPERSIAA